MAANESYSPLWPERLPAKHALGLIRTWGTGSRQETRQIRAPLGTEGFQDYWLLLPVLLFLAGAAAALGVSVLRTLPQGSEEALASGIFLRESL